MRVKPRITAVACALVLAVVAAPAVAAADEASRVPTSEEVRAFLDEQVPAMLRDAKVPGASVSVVSREGTLVDQGYGDARVGRSRRPVETSRTAFPIDSTGKLMTTTAVMQLVEAGKLDLHTDINEYLRGFRIADTYPGKPVTLAHLLTHSGGFEERNVGSMTTKQPDELGTFLKENPLARVRPPGDVATYSNYGMGLAGHIVELQSGETFEKYVERHVLRPLGMRHTFVGQPDAVARTVDVAPGYRVAGDGYEQVRRWYDQIVPSGAVVSTAPDMGRFMRAHLTGGGGVLRPETVRLMQERHFGQHPKLPGMAYSFHEEERSGVRLLTHSGDGSGSHGKLALAPRAGVGIYLVTNGDGVDAVSETALADLIDRFVDRFLASPGAEARTVSSPAAAVTGTYRNTRISETDPTRLLAAMSATVTVRDGGGGMLVTHGLAYDPEVDEQRWRPVGDRVYKEVDGQQRIAFVRDHEGRLVLADSADPSSSYERLAWYESLQLHGIVLAVALVVLATTLAWPVAAVARRALGRTVASTRGGTAARVVAGSAVALIACSLASVILLGTNPDMPEYVLTASPRLQATLLPSTLAAVPAGVAVVATVVAWRQGWWRIPGRVHYTLVTAAACGTLALAYAYRVWSFGG